MNIALKKLPELLSKESGGLEEEKQGFARLLEFKLVSPDAKYHAYIQIIIARDALRPYALWRKFKADTSLTHGETLWEATAEYDPDLIKGSIKMMEERIEDLADKAGVKEAAIILSFEMSRAIVLDQVLQTRDAKHSFLVRITRGKRHQRHV